MYQTLDLDRGNVTLLTFSTLLKAIVNFRQFRQSLTFCNFFRQIPQPLAYGRIYAASWVLFINNQCITSDIFELKVDLYW